MNYDDKIKEDELEKDVEVDIYSLEDENAKQTTIHNKWSRRLRQAIILNDKYSERYRILVATLFKKARMGAFNLEGNMTDVAVKYWIESREDYKKALHLRNKYSSLVKMLEGIMFTLSQRKESLERLTKLFLNNYYSEIKLSNEQKEVLEEKILEEQRRKFRLSMKNDRRKKHGKKRKEI